ncbi:serine/threonine protein kinase [bacterium]|nr:serine/threonine protein kinase [bacterium]
MALALTGGVRAQELERRLTFLVEPASAEVLIANHTGGYDRYPVQTQRWVKFPSPAVNLVIEAPGWKSQTIPVNVNQFNDQWPTTGTLKLAPASWQARLASLPRWPWLLILLVPLAARARVSRAVKPPPAQTSQPVNQLPWELKVGEEFASYRVLERLGEGVSAVVYRVQSEDGELALKLMKPQHFRDAEVLPRFRREMTALTRLRHPSIPLLMDFGEARGMNYLVMELLAPRSLLDSLRSGPLPPDQAVPVLKQITEALVVCHGQGILHRDIKPENVVWGLDGKVRLTDFGLARPHDASTLTMEGSLLGTPAYMAPEIVQGYPTSPSSDLYSLGCLAHHVLSGRPPFEGESPLAVLMQHVNSEPPPLDQCPPQLQDWVRRCMAKTPEQRFASSAEALSHLPAGDL